MKRIMIIEETIMKSNKKVEYFALDDEQTDRPITKKEFLNIQKEELAETCFSYSDLLKKKPLTRSEIDKLIKEKILSPINYKGKIYFKKDAILKHLNKENI